MIIFDAERPSDSPFIERIWHSYSEGNGTFFSVAESRWEIVITKYPNQLFLTVRGPETKATSASYDDGGEWLGIRFRPGTFLRPLPASCLINTSMDVPSATRRTFWLGGSAWQFPDFNNADTFVDRLIRNDLLLHEPAIDAIFRGQQQELSLRTVQRRFLQMVGVTQNTARQIERARYATNLLRQGHSILDTVEDAGYFDQPHLTRSLRHFIGQTPTQIARKSQSKQLSFLYKITPFR